MKFKRVSNSGKSRKLKSKTRKSKTRNKQICISNGKRMNCSKFYKKFGVFLNRV
jgi:hypothetical protein